MLIRPPEVNELREDVANDMPMHIGEAELPALVAVGQPFVIEAKAMQNCCLQVVNVHRVFNDVETKVVEVNSGRPVSDGVANDSGTIVLDRVPRGRYRLVVSAPGHRDVVRDVRIDADQTLEIDLEAR